MTRQPRHNGHGRGPRARRVAIVAAPAEGSIITDGRGCVAPRERRLHMPGVKQRRIDRLLQVHALMHKAQDIDQLPLVLLIAPPGLPKARQVRPPALASPSSRCPVTVRSGLQNRLPGNGCQHARQDRMARVGIVDRGGHHLCKAHRAMIAQHHHPAVKRPRHNFGQQARAGDYPPPARSCAMVAPAGATPWAQITVGLSFPTGQIRIGKSPKVYSDAAPPRPIP